MESNITSQQAFSADLQLAEPHFDEEATLLAARPVVPLSRVKTQMRSGRILTFALAIVVALVVGALSATLIYKQRGQAQETALVEPSPLFEPTSAENPTASEVPGVAIQPGAAKPAVAESEVAVAARESRNADAAKQLASLVSQNVEAAKRLKGHNETLNKKDRKEMRRAERVDAGPSRSVKNEPRREARRNQPADGVLRIRDIFEGPPRP